MKKQTKETIIVVGVILFCLLSDSIWGMVEDLFFK